MKRKNRFLILFFRIALVSAVVWSCTAAPVPLEEQSPLELERIETSVPVIEEGGVPAVPAAEEPAEEAEAEDTGTEEAGLAETGAVDYSLRREIEGFVFIPDPVSAVLAAPGVGTITRERRDYVSTLSGAERSLITKAFQDAYVDGLLRASGLTGALGGDLVHGWPEANPLSWAQNWQTSIPRPNSWGLPSLVLAVKNSAPGEAGQSRVFTVQGDILDFYGRGAGINGANGNAGYGSPRGEEFLYQGKLAQCFDKGVITIDENGRGSFLAETPPSERAEISVSLEGEGNADVEEAFAAAWKTALDCRMAGDDGLVPDGPVQYHALTEGWNVYSNIEARGFYFLTFNQKSSLLILPDPVYPSSLPLYARFLGFPFLPLVVEGRPLAGTDAPLPLNAVLADGEEFLQNLETGLAIYGLPLTDPLYRKSEDNTTPVMAQRFARGWIQFKGSP